MESLTAALNEHADLVHNIVQKLSTEIRSGFAPAYASFVGFFHAVDWKEPWLICLLAIQGLLLLIVIISRKKVNFQLCLSILAFSGVFLAEKINSLLELHWKSFAGQNYFDHHGLFMSVIWSGPLLLMAIIIVVNMLVTLCQQIIKWKRAELRHRAKLARSKED